MLNKEDQEHKKDIVLKKVIQFVLSASNNSNANETNISANDEQHLKQFKDELLLRYSSNSNNNNDDDDDDDVSNKCSSKMKNDAIATINTTTEYNNDVNKLMPYLNIEIISGGVSNYSYKISFPNCNNDDDSSSNDSIIPVIALYAKLSMEKLFLDKSSNSDEKNDIQRTQSEYEIIQLFSKHIDSNMVATPYACLDLQDKNDNSNMKLLITKYCHTNDEQMSKQFKLGIIDQRLSNKLAKALASLHSFQNYNTNLNQTCRDFYFYKGKQFLRHAFDTELLIKKTAETSSSGNVGRAAALCQTLNSNGDTTNTLEQIYNNFLQLEYERECLIHNDFHFFNIIVETSSAIMKNDIITDTDEKALDPESDSTIIFGPYGSATIVDWEMSFEGNAGSDVGRGLGYVIACAIAHALNGNTKLSKNCITFCNNFWNSYVNRIQSRFIADNNNFSSSTLLEQRLEQLIEKRFKDTLGGGIGVMAYVGHYVFGVHMDEESLPALQYKEDLKYVRDSIGFIGLTLLQITFGTKKAAKEEKNAKRSSSSSNYKQMRAQYEKLIQNEIERAYNIHLQRIKKSGNNEEQNWRDMLYA